MSGDIGHHTGKSTPDGPLKVEDDFLDGGFLGEEVQYGTEHSAVVRLLPPGHKGEKQGQTEGKTEVKGLR